MHIFLWRKEVTLLFLTITLLILLAFSLRFFKIIFNSSFLLDDLESHFSMKFGARDLLVIYFPMSQIYGLATFRTIRSLVWWSLAYSKHLTVRVAIFQTSLLWISSFPFHTYLLLAFFQIISHRLLLRVMKRFLLFMSIVLFHRVQYFLLRFVNNFSYPFNSIDSSADYLVLYSSTYFKSPRSFGSKVPTCINCINCWPG